MNPSPITSAAVFDGAASFLTLPITPSTTAFSLWFWAKPNRFTANDRLIDWQIGGPTDGFTINSTIPASNGRSFQVNINNGASAQATFNTPWDLTGFNHYVITYSVNSAKLYCNNVLISTDTSVTMTTAATTLTVGKRATAASNFFNGKIAKFGFLNGRVITVAEIAAIYSLDSNPSDTTAYYTFNGNTNDQTANGNNATPTSILYQTYPQLLPTTTLSPKAINSFSTTTSVATVTDTAVLRVENNNAFSWSAWVWLFKTNNNLLPRIIEKGSDYLAIMGDQTNGQRNHLAMEIVGSDTIHIEYWGSTRLEAFNWYHIAGVMDSTGHLYINGTAEVITPLVGPYNGTLASTSGSDVKIGNSSGASRNWPGLIRNIRQYSVALTATEILALSQNQNITRGLVGRWDMTEGTGTTVVDLSGNGNGATLTSIAWETT